MGINKLTERTGFEPAVRFDPYTDLANRRYRPLSHLSKFRSTPLPTHYKKLRVASFCSVFSKRGGERRDLLRSVAGEPSLSNGSRLCPNCRPFSSR
jgi:hypothetical protein